VGRRISCGLFRREFLSIKLNLKRVGECDWVETRAWNQIGIKKRGFGRAIAREKSRLGEFLFGVLIFLVWICII